MCHSFKEFELKSLKFLQAKVPDYKMSVSYNGYGADKCLFCAEPCPPTFTTTAGQVKRVKIDPDNHHPFRLDGDDCPLLAEQLKVVFILKNILGIKEEKLGQFLGRLDGQLDPQFWVSVCGTCGEAVRAYYETFKEILKLQKRLTTISSQLKDQIRESGGNEDVPNSQSVWKEVRDEIINPWEKEIKHPIYSFDALVVGKDAEDDDSRETLINGDPFNYDEGREYPFLLEEVPEEPPEEPPASIVPQQPTFPEMETCDLGEVREYTLPSLPNSSPLNYLIFREGRQTRYKCLDCGFLTPAYCRLKRHFELHGPDSGAVACAFCGVLVGSGPRRMELHKTTYHAAPLLQLRPSKKADVLTYFECADCGALYQSRWRLKKHKRQLHSQDSQGETCGECGWVVPNLGKHVGYWHPREGSKVAELRKQRYAGGLRIVKDEDGPVFQS